MKLKILQKKLIQKNLFNKPVLKSKIRKRILDLGNDTIRELEDYFDKFIEYNNNNKK